MGDAAAQAQPDRGKDIDRGDRVGAAKPIGLEVAKVIIIVRHRVPAKDLYRAEADRGARPEAQ
jgi:hypothetical protein